jgi:hypothetical protein
VQKAPQGRLPASLSHILDADPFRSPCLPERREWILTQTVSKIPIGSGIVLMYR